MVTLRVAMDDRTIHEGVASVLPRADDRIERDRKTYRVESVVWRLPTGSDGDIIVTAAVEDLQYTV